MRGETRVDDINNIEVVSKCSIATETQLVLFHKYFKLYITFQNLWYAVDLYRSRPGNSNHLTLIDKPRINPKIFKSGNSIIHVLFISHFCCGLSTASFSKVYSFINRCRIKSITHTSLYHSEIVT